MAQETTVYGVDLYGKKSLHLLLHELNQIPGLYWIRLMYCYPEEIYEELIEAIRDNDKVCHYIDMPIQHINSDILKKDGTADRPADAGGENQRPAGSDSGYCPAYNADLRIFPGRQKSSMRN